LQSVACRHQARPIGQRDVSWQLPERHRLGRGEAFPHLLKRQIGPEPISVLDVRRLAARIDAGVIELTYQIGVENMRARMYSALGITEQGFNSGDACRVPWASEEQQAASR